MKRITLTPKLQNDRQKFIRMKKIIFSDNTLWGLLNFRSGVINYFRRNEFEVVLVAPHDPLVDLSTIPEGVRYIPIELHNISRNPFYDIRYFRTLKSIYRIENPDYIFHYTIKPNIYGTLAAHSLGIRSTSMVAGLGHIFSSNSAANLVARKMFKYAMRFSEYIFVLNQSNRDTLISREVVDKEKIIWLEGGEGVDLERFSMQENPNNEKVVFLMVTRLLFEKGYTEYVNAAQKLKGKAEFRIMGPTYEHPSGVPLSKIKEDEASGAIRYIEYSPFVTSQMASADCIVLPSFYGEGLSRVLMEGLAMGKPIICTNIPGCRETVDEALNGFLCLPKDSDSLIKACEKFVALTTQERLKMGIESRRRAERIFDEQLVLKEYLAIIEGK